MIDILTSFINENIQIFNAYALINPIIAGVMGLWGLGVVSYLVRNIPKNLWLILIKQSTTSLTILNTSQVYHNFLNWYTAHHYANKLRSVKISSGRWGEGNALKSIGYGNHYLIIDYHFIKINLTKVESQSSSMEIDEIKITILGRNQKFFNKLLEKINIKNQDPQRIPVYKFYDTYWKKVTDQFKRNINTIFLDHNKKQTLINHLNNFIKNKDWYDRMGISYQTGILLYGIPGGGKTSLIKAIASMYNYDLYILSVKNLKHIDNAIDSLPHNTILLIEDIDTNIVTQTREDKIINSLDPTNLSDILNALDGIIANNGRILIATTNHINKLDNALIRPGRFDLTLELGYITTSVACQFFNTYYPNFDYSPNFNVQESITPATLQNWILTNLDNPSLVYEKVREK